MATELFEMDLAPSPHDFSQDSFCHASLEDTLENGDACRLSSCCTPMEADGFVMVRDSVNGFELQVVKDLMF